MISAYFMDVPVYRVEHERYYEQMEEFISKGLYSNPERTELQKEFYKRNPGHETIFREHLQNKYGGAWNYNEIIGYIQLHFLGSQIRGEYWGQTAKRIIRTRKKSFEWKTHKLAPELEIPRDSSNSKIYEIILNYLSHCQKELKGRYIDEAHIRAIGPYVDWNSLRRNA
jgi:hypothetical protein